MHAFEYYNGQATCTIRFKFGSNENYKANETFKFLRQGLDLTQEELAKNIKASKSSIEKYEYGTVNYTFETLLKIDDKYNLNIIIETKK